MRTASKALPRRDGAGLAQRGESNSPAPGVADASSAQPCAKQPAAWKLWTAMGLLTAVFLWSYWPTFKELIHVWEHQPDYSHGWLVVPISAYILWRRRADCPQFSRKWAWAGMALIVLSLAIRILGSFWFFGPLVGWSIPIWVAGACWFLAGWPVARWAMPAIAFLMFMIPLPFRGESLLSGPLQAVAARLSCFTLQCLGEPVIREGNVIVTGGHRVAVAEACSGLRIFMSIVALGLAYLLVIRPTRRVTIGLLLAVPPIALATNAVRIVVTAWLFGHDYAESTRHFWHDAAGWLMMPFAFALMAVTVIYCERLFVEADVRLPRDLLSTDRTKRKALDT